MARGTELTLIVIFSCLASQIKCQTGGTGGPSPAGSASTLPTTTLAPGQCPSNTCQNGATCYVCSYTPNSCPVNLNRPYYCLCKADNTDSDCSGRRVAVKAVTVKTSGTYTAEYANLSSDAAMKLTNSLKTITQAACQSYYSNKSIDGLSFNVQVVGYSSGSIVANMLVSIGISATSSANVTQLTTPTAAEMTAALNNACTGTLCSSIGLDTTSASVTANVSLCASSLTNNCSQYAACSFTSGVSYTCACNTGYKDVYSNGFTCTQSCSTGACSSRGTCTEVMGAQYTCACNSGFSGNNCQNGSHRVQQSMVLLFLFAFILPLAHFRSFIV